MRVQRFIVALCACALLGVGKPALVLIPYQETAETGPVKLTEMLLSDLAAAGIKAISVDPIDHLDAVASAGRICAENHADGILIPEGRVESTGRLSYFVVASTVTYEWHVEFRLDLVDCRGAVRHSALTTGDKSSTGVLTPVSPGAANPQLSAPEAAFQSAMQNAVQEYVASPIDLGSQNAPLTPAPAPTPTFTSKFLLVPVEQPGLADPNAPAVTTALLAQMKLRNLDVILGTPIDHLTTFASAEQLCASNGVQGIIVPRLGLVQIPFNGGSGARVRLNLLACNGASVGYGSGQGILKKAPKHDFSAAIVEASKEAMGPALDQLFPSTKT
jgi:hypothetical protein